MYSTAGSKIELPQNLRYGTAGLTAGFTAAIPKYMDKYSKMEYLALLHFTKKTIYMNITECWEYADTGKWKSIQIGWRECGSASRET